MSAQPHPGHCGGPSDWATSFTRVTCQQCKHVRVIVVKQGEEAPVIRVSCPRCGRSAMLAVEHCYAPLDTDAHDTLYWTGKTWKFAHNFDRYREAPADEL